jgi:DNA-binding NarL/FixJ family response regulator
MTTTVQMGADRPERESLVRVLLVASDAFLRHGLRRNLAERGVCVVAEAATTADALPVVGRTVADVVVMDVDGLGIGAARELIEGLPEAPPPGFVAIARTGAPQVALALLRAGVCGYVVRDAPVEHLRLAVCAAAVGVSMLSPEPLAELLDLLPVSEHRTPKRHPAVNLTERELEILGLVAEGADNQEIATRLLLSVSTVKAHMSTILMKLHVRNRIQAAVYAVKEGLV